MCDHTHLRFGGQVECPKGYPSALNELMRRTLVGRLISKSMEFFVIIDVQGPSVWTLKDPGTFLTYGVYQGSPARYSCPAINILKVCSGRRVLAVLAGIGQ